MTAPDCRAMLADLPDPFLQTGYVACGDHVTVPGHPEITDAHVDAIRIDPDRPKGPVMVDYASGEDGHHYSGTFSVAPRDLLPLVTQERAA